MNRLSLPLFLACGSFAFAADIAIPRYRLEVGKEIIYDSSSDFKHTNGSHRSTSHLTLWVTRQNPDGGWHLIGHGTSEFSQSMSGQSSAPPARKDEVFGEFDLTPQGSIPKKPKGYRAAQLTAPFFPLPESLDKARAGWERANEDSGGTNHYQLDESSDLAKGPWIFRQTSRSLFNEIYLSSSEARISFDPARGLVTRSDSTSSQGWGFNGKGTGVLELQSVKKTEPEWLAQFIREADLYFTAAAALSDAYADKKNSGTALAQAETKLRDARSRVALPFIQARFDHAIENLADSAKYVAEDRDREASVQDKPSPDWQFTDLDGRTHKLADYRGKVLLLDFWYRGCGWCIRAMPQLKEVADHYREKPVAVLGMNTDRDEKDARFVHDKLALNYPTLRAEGLPEKYKINGFPTLVLIDQEGIVRGRHVGYSPTLRDSLIKDIDALLVHDKK